LRAGSKDHTSSITISKSLLHNQKFLDAFSAKMMTISTMLKGNQQTSEPIRYKVVSIDDMLDSDYWQTPQEIESRGLCVSGFNTSLPVWQQNIQKAMSLYGAYLKAPSVNGIYVYPYI
jgi:hypothetical protein